MPQPPIFKPVTDKLKNALAAIVGRAVRSIKRFVTALHNRCNLVVYVDEKGRTCCQFLKKDAFSGYHFAFSGNECLVTNKESGEIYTVTSDRPSCTCPAYKYDRTKSPCKHMKMVAEVTNSVKKNEAGLLRSPVIPIDKSLGLKPASFFKEQSVRGDLEQAVLKTQKECDHPKAIIGLDAHYCPDCKKSIEYGTAAYEEILNRDTGTEKKTKKAIIIDPLDVPTGIQLRRTDDWMCIEYNVDAWGYKNINRERHIVPINIGRIVEHSNGIYTYRIRSGVARVFEKVLDAIAYLVQVAGTSFEECAAAHWEFNSF